MDDSAKQVESAALASAPGCRVRAEKQSETVGRRDRLESLRLELGEAHAHHDALARRLERDCFSFRLARRGAHIPPAEQIVAETAGARGSVGRSAKEQELLAEWLACFNRNSVGNVGLGGRTRNRPIRTSGWPSLHQRSAKSNRMRSHFSRGRSCWHVSLDDSSGGRSSMVFTVI